MHVLDDGVGQQLAGDGLALGVRDAAEELVAPGRADRIDGNAHVANGLLGRGRHRVHHPGLQVDLDQRRPAGGCRPARPVAKHVLLDDRIGQELLGHAAGIVSREIPGQEEQPPRAHSRYIPKPQLDNLAMDLRGVRVAEAFLGIHLNAMDHSLPSSAVFAKAAFYPPAARRAIGKAHPAPSPYSRQVGRP